MTTMKKFIVPFVFFISILFFPQDLDAAKKVLPQTKNKTSSTISKKSKISGITVSPKLRWDRLALLVYFGNLQNANNVSYMLIYKTNGQEEAAGGAVTPNGKSNASQEILFGTCSKNVCRYHPGLSDMRLEVTADLKSGKKLFKRYRIRI